MEDRKSVLLSYIFLGNALYHLADFFCCTGVVVMERSEMSDRRVSSVTVAEK